MDGLTSNFSRRKTLGAGLDAHRTRRCVTSILGCGTTIAAAQKLNREWIGIDVTHLAVGLMKLRLKDSFGMLPVGEKKAASSVPSLKGTQIIAQGKAEGRDPGNDQQSRPDPEGVARSAADVAPLQGAEADADISPGFYPGLLSSSPSATGGYYRVIGQPEDLDGAKELAEKDKYGFQWWVLPLIGAKAFGSEAGKKEGKKGADGGIDGMIVFTDDNSGKAKKVIVSVKGGHCNVSQIRDLGHVIDRENAAIARKSGPRKSGPGLRYYDPLKLLCSSTICR